MNERFVSLWEASKTDFDKQVNELLAEGYKILHSGAFVRNDKITYSIYNWAHLLKEEGETK